MLRTRPLVPRTNGLMSTPAGSLLVRMIARAVKDYWCWRWKVGSPIARTAGSHVKEWVQEDNDTFSLAAMAIGTDEKGLRRLFDFIFEQTELGIPTPINARLSIRMARIRRKLGIDKRWDCSIKWD